MTTVTGRAPSPATAVPTVAVTRQAPAVRAGVVRRSLGALLLVAFLGTCVARGLPTDRLVLLGWVVAALVVHALGRGRAELLRLLADWVPLAGLLLLYDLTRGLADGLGMPVHVAELAAADRWLFGGVLPTAWLQEHWTASAWAAFASLVYGSHFVVTPVLLAVLWVRDRARWTGYARLVLGLSAAGLVTYVLYPAAPPWFAARDGVIEQVDRISSSGWAVLGLHKAGAVLSSGQAQVNQVAAVPSLHTAFAVLTALVLWPLARRAWQRAALAGYAVSMPVVLVWSGEHYVVDTLLGAVYAAAVWALLPRLVRWCAGAARRPAPPAVASSAPVALLPRPRRSPEA
ncbi:phosphatase PAP2 family protein [Modestobacter roseus]|uniref:PAP2 superfamily protein n=1 Tax=Modestobacter roseus TaxID=1181884 RepID=A0A562IS46_9ACTN|nr:phosphatase PAP2 family protein [Modestobacter roseus]MQA32084.1 phosphatase PAP2 family protein [Modestobacter roseus]TWH73384.1 PAP2 superfamily protein [Modestobacter roseus]